LIRIAKGGREPMDATLVYFKDNGERKDFNLKPGRTTIGRKENCNYRIPLSSVSREHCQFDLTDKGLLLRDLNSSNGTYVNNKRIAEAKLRPGDHVVIGPVVFTVQIDGFPPDPKPVKVRLEERDKKASADEAMDDILGGDDDATRKSGTFAESGAGLAATDVSSPEDEDALQALEALAGGKDDSDINPFEDMDDDDTKGKKKKK
jgi:pSer/pThr/pTyr-binding forkhead associated (FHA) protein